MNNSNNEQFPYIIDGWAIVGYNKGSTINDPKGVIVEITTFKYILEEKLAELQKHVDPNLIELKLEYVSNIHL